MRAFLNRFDTRVSIAYCLTALLWILTSDSLVGILFASNPDLLRTAGTLKGFGFVLVTTGALFLVVSRELRKRLRTETALRQEMQTHRETAAAHDRVAHLYRLLSDANQILVRATDEQTLLQSICELLIQQGDYRLAWVGYRTDDERRSVRPMAAAGDQKDYVQAITVTWDDSPTGHGPAGTAIRTGQPSIARFILTDPRFAPWRSEAIKRGYSSAIALPITSGGAVIGALNVYAQAEDAFDQAETKLLIEMANDLGYGIQALRTQLGKEEARVELAASEEKYRSLVDSTDADIVLLDAEGRILYLNDIASSRHDLKPADLVGKTVYDVNPAEQADIVMEQIRWVFAHNTSILGEARMTIGRHSGWFRMSVQPVRENGVPVAALIYANDITEHKMAELKALAQNQILHQSRDFMALGDLEGNSVFMNRGGAALVGVDDPAYFVGKPIGLVHTPEDADKVLTDYLPHALATGFWRGENRLLAHDGRLVDVEQTIFPIRDENGSIIQVATIMTDITERKRAEEALREANDRLEQRVRERTAELENTKDRLEAIFHHSGDAILLLHLTEGIRQANTTFDELFDTHPDQYVGQALSAFFEPDNGTPLEEAIAQVAETHQTRHVVARARCEENTLCETVEISIAPINRSDHAVRNLVCIVRNITERRRAEAELEAKREQELEMQGYLKSLHEITLRLTQAETLDEFCRWTVEMGLERFGFERMGLLLRESSGAVVGTYGTDAEGRVLAEPHVRIDPKDMSAVLKATLDRRTRFAFLEGAPLFYNAQPIDVGQNAAAALWNGELLGWLAVDNARHHQAIRSTQLDVLSLYAVTVGSLLARKRAEQQALAVTQRLELATRAAGIGIWDWNLVEDSWFWDEGMGEIFGLSEEERAHLEEGGRKYIHPEDLARLLEDFANTLNTGALLESEYRIIHRNGESRHIRNSGLLLRDDKGSPAHVVGVTLDVTHLKSAEAALHSTLQKERELNSLKSRFISMASHEFRTPMAAIMATAETLIAYRARMTDEQIGDRLHKIRQQIGHMKELVEGVLDLSRIQAGRMEYTPEPGDLCALCQEIVEEFASQASYQDRVLYACAQEHLHTRFDKRLMRHVIANLVQNALKYSPSEKPVHVVLSEDEAHITLTVRDEGIGIPPDDLKHLFEPFHRATNVGAIPGSGLGLSIVKQAAEAHGGIIRVESELDCGTTFTFVLPKQGGE
ncbi:MAG: PAS domain S-box protein [Chloroflexi bacterium]|nr:PAS domain S-box protein [Chloroflexota bacterium]